MSKDEHEALSCSDSDSSSRTSHQNDKDSEQGDIGNSDTYLEDENESESTLDHWTTNATEERHGRMTDATEDSVRRTTSASKVHPDCESFSEPRTTNATDEHRTNNAQTNASKAHTESKHTATSHDTSCDDLAMTPEGPPTKPPMATNADQDADALTNKTGEAIHGPEQTRLGLETRGSCEAFGNGMYGHFAAIEVDLSPGRYRCGSPRASAGLH